MRSRDRERVERHAASALAEVAPPLRLLVGWTLQAWPHDDMYGEAFTFGKHAVIVLDEVRFQDASPEEREDIMRHELAHVVAWHWHGHEIADHGPEYQRARRAIDRALDEEIDAT